MVVYALRKLLASIPVFLGVTFFVFVLFNVVGGDPALLRLGRHATAAQLVEIRHQMHLDLPLWRQYAEYLREVVTFDYGRSWTTQQPIREVLLDGIGPSLSLLIPSFLLLVGLSVPLGLLVAYFRGRAIDRIAIFLCVFVMSISIVALIIFGQYFLAYRLGWFPVSGLEPGFPECLRFVALPSLLFVAVSLGWDVRLYRTVVLEETGQDYVRTARAKGVGEPRVYLKHILRNCLAPILTNAVTNVPFFILGMFVLESFFGIPGLGGITVDALNNSDFPVIKAMTTLLASLVILINIVTDVLYAVVDPRVSLQ